MAFLRLADCMLWNYLKVAYRNLWKRKGYSFLNITGLAIGMASAILIALWIYNEVSVDRFHKNKDDIYQAWNRGSFDNILQCWNSTPKILGPTLKIEHPEVVQIARMFNRGFVTIAGEAKVSSWAMVADPAFLTMFSFPLIAGNPKTALDGPASMVVTQKMAKKMFGSEDVLNKNIRIDSILYTITGVMKDLPPNTDFGFELIIPWSFLQRTGDDDAWWGNNSIQTWVQLRPGTNITAFNEKIRNTTINHSNRTEMSEVFLHPLTKVHLYSNFVNGKQSGGRIDMVRLFMVIAVFILLIACINFMNLTTARSEKRAKEVGIRKVAGASRHSLIGQFLGESLLISFISGLLALLIVQFSMPQFILLVGKQLNIPYNSQYFWIALTAFVLITGILAGSYPAFFLSAFQPVAVLKGTFRRAFHAINPRKVLVVVQFSFAIIMIISTFIIIQQINHAQNRDAGYSRDRLVYIWMTGEMYEKYPLFKRELLNSGIASDVTKTSSPLTDRMSDTWSLTWKGKAADDKTDFERFSEDEGLVKTAGFKLVQGRDMDLQTFPGDSNAMLINETAAKAMRFDNPIGQIVRDDGFEFHIVGVIKDFILSTPYDYVKPIVIQGIARNWFNVVHIRIAPGRTTSAALAAIEKVFNKYNPAFPYENHFIDQDYARKFEDMQRTGRLTGLFAVLTVFISCLGLFGLATYMAAARIKEIGVRKVLGASVVRITSLLAADFLKLVFISILIAVPISWYAMHNWLQDYSYRISISWWIFFVAGVTAILISFLTVSYQSIRAALSNPVKSLRTE